MPEWINNKDAGFVIAAYAVAACALVGMLVVSVCAQRRRAKEWQALQHRNEKE